MDTTAASNAQPADVVKTKIHCECKNTFFVRAIEINALGREIDPPGLQAGAVFCLACGALHVRVLRSIESQRDAKAASPWIWERREFSARASAFVAVPE